MPEKLYREHCFHLVNVVWFARENLRSICLFWVCQKRLLSNKYCQCPGQHWEWLRDAVGLLPSSSKLEVSFWNTFLPASVFSSHFPDFSSRFSSQIFAHPQRIGRGVIIQLIRITELGLRPRKSEHGLTR